MICLYVDDCIIHANNDSIITDFILKMREKQYLLQDEGKIEDFLGVHIDTTVNGQFEMTQTGLIKEIIHDLNLDHESCKYDLFTVPAKNTLQADLHLPEFCEDWKYRSVIGKLNFLALNSRPDIAFPVHQCAHWNSNP